MASAQVSFTGTPYVQNFNSLSGTTNNTADVTWTDNSTLPGWYASKSAYHVTDATMGGAATNFDSTSATNNIGLISFGTAGSTDRALGSRATGTNSLSTSNNPVRYGVRLVNNTAATITNFSILLTGEQWYASTQSAAHTLQLDYQLGATSLTSGTWVSNFTTFTAPISTGTTARALDGNAAANRRGVAGRVNAISWIPGQELWVRVTDTNETGNEQGLAIDDFVFTTGANSSLFFNGSNNHVTMGAATSTLGASVLTLEAWVFRTGTGTTTSTGTGGVTAFPIVTKGRGESETAGLNCNYFLGINASNKLVADFEAAAASGITTGQNYPVSGASDIPLHQWTHVAATYDGGATDGEKWKLFVNGVKDTSSATTGVNPPANAAPEAISTQHFAIGTAMNSSGTREGTFLGLIDEVRVWNVARSGAQIAGNMNAELVSGTGLLARYGFGEGTGTSTASSVAGAPAGTLVGSPMWMHGNSFVSNINPTATLTAPLDADSYDAPASVTLTATAADADGTIARVEFFSGSTKIGEDSSAPYEFVWENVLSGSYSLTARAIDDLGGTGTSSPATITVTNTDNVSPTVSLTSPADGAIILTNSITLNATAADADGVISKVEFFNGATKLGEDTTAPYSFQWNSVAVGDYTLTAVATDNDGAATTSASATIEVAVPIANTLVAKGATWKYLDNGTDQGSAWKESSFDDSAWAAGPAKLGYEDGAVTTLRQGPSGMTSATKYITYYFRRSFEVSGAAAVQSLNLNILRDDGVVVYINGQEVARQNMPAGVIDYLTNSSAIVSGSDETTYFPSVASPLPVLNDGINTIAVELHQRDNASSDLAFDLELISLTPPGPPPTVALSAPLDAATFTAPATIPIAADAADSDGTITKVEFFNGSEKLGEDSTAPYTFDWAIVPQGSYVLTARATDSSGQSTTSSPVNISVGAPNTAAPTVSITSPANNAGFIAPATINIVADASDSDGTVTKVEFFNGGTKLGEDLDAPFSFTWSNVAAGAYTLTAKATDDMTATTTSAPVSISVAVNQAPAIALASPGNAATDTGNGGTVSLQANVSDPESQALTVTFYGREKSPAPGPDFTLVTLPDTQFYSENSGGNRLQHFISQTNWIVSSKNSLNTAFVAHMGDMVQNGDSVQQEWINADSAMDIVEDPLTTLLTHGIPWGGAPGNHDQQPIGSPDGASVYWNQYFGVSRWAGRPYFGGNYGTNNDNNFQLFSASGLDFIIINLEYRPSANQAVLDWADALLKAHPTRRAIITSHWLISTGNPASWGGHGQAVYDNLKDNPNLFLMLCGHIHGEGQRADTFEGRTVYTVLQDYQSRSNGGDSWLRYFTFSPANNTISAKTYQTRTGTFETDADSQFTLPYAMGAGSVAWVPLGTVNIPAGETTAALDWSGLVGNTEYEWYAAVSDGATPVATAPRTFTTAANTAPSVAITAPTEGAVISLPDTVDIVAEAADADGSIAKVEFYNGATKIGEDETAPYEFSWTAVSGSYALTARAIDNQSAATDSAAINITVTNPANIVPTVSLTAPANGATIIGSTIAMTADASDTDGNITKVEFYNGVTKVGEDLTQPYAFSQLNASPGAHVLSARAFDNDGGITVSSGVSVTLVPAGAFTGTYSQSFDEMGASGTTPPQAWSVWNSTGSNSTWTNSIPISSALIATMTANTSGLTASNAPTANANNGYNAGAPGTPANRMLGSAPTTVAGMAFQLELTNTTASPITALEIGYDIQRFTAASSVNELPGYWLFQSLDNGTTWTNISALNPTVTGSSGVIVPNSIGVTTVSPTVSPTAFALSGAWAQNTKLLLRWVDDNAVATSPDQVHGLDNVLIDLPTPFEQWKIVNTGNPTTPDNSDTGDTDGLELLLEFAFGLNPQASYNIALVADVPNGTLTTRGVPVLYQQNTSSGVDFRALFMRRKDSASVGLSYRAQFSHDMTSWTYGTHLPIVIADSGDYELVSVRYPLFLDGRKARFFRIEVTPTNP